MKIFKKIFQFSLTHNNARFNHGTFFVNISFPVKVYANLQYFGIYKLMSHQSCYICMLSPS
jgi:hypothetical protein